MGTCFCSPQSYTSSSFSEPWGAHPPSPFPTQSPYPTLHHSPTYQPVHHSPTYTTASPSFITSSPSYGSGVPPSSPYQWGEVSSTQDLAAATYIREFEEAYRGIPNSCQQQQQLGMDDSLCQQQVDCFQQYPLDTEFFQPNQIFQLDHPISENTQDRFNNPAFDGTAVRYEPHMPDIRPNIQNLRYVEPDFVRESLKFPAVSDRLGHEKIEFDNPGDYPDLYTAPAPSQGNQRTNIQTFPSGNQFQPSPANYGELVYEEGEGWRFPASKVEGEGWKYSAPATSKPTQKKDLTPEVDFDQLL